MTRASILHRWEYWWLRPVPPHALAIFRIAFGAFLLLVWGLKIPHIATLFSREGLLLPLWPELQQGSLVWLFFPSPLTAWTLFGIFYACLLLITLGAFLRSAGTLAFLLNLYYWALSLHLFNTSFDRLFIVLLLVVAWSGADRTLSLRAWWRRGSWMAWEPASILPQRLIAFQITAVYLGVGLQKLWLPDWQNGDVLTYSLLSVWGSEAAYRVVRWNWPMAAYDALLFVVKFFEVVIPFGLWMPHMRSWVIAGGIFFHVAIAVLLRIWWFLILIPAYIVFMDPEELQRFLAMWMETDTRTGRNK